MPGKLAFVFPPHLLGFGADCVNIWLRRQIVGQVVIVVSKYSDFLAHNLSFRLVPFRAR